MATTVRNLETARRVTVRVCDKSGEPSGQGLILTLDGEGTVILTCHHVVARLNSENLCVAIPRPDGQLATPIRAKYDEHRSYPARDAAVLRIEASQLSEQPLLHALNPATYTGSLPDRAVCLGHNAA